MNYGLIVLILVVVIIVTVKLKESGSGKNFICPKCGKEVQPTKVETLLSVHAGSSKLIKCPYCNARSMMKPKEHN